MKVRGNDALEVLAFSDNRYESLTVEIQFDGEPIAQINQDGKVPELEFFAADKGDARPVKMSVQDFEEALKMGLAALIA